MAAIQTDIFELTEIDQAEQLNAYKQSRYKWKRLKYSVLVRTLIVFSYDSEVRIERRRISLAVYQVDGL